MCCTKKTYTFPLPKNISNTTYALRCICTLDVKITQRPTSKP